MHVTALATDTLILCHCCQLCPPADLESSPSERCTCAGKKTPEWNAIHDTVKQRYGSGGEFMSNTVYVATAAWKDESDKMQQFSKNYSSDSYSARQLLTDVFLKAPLH